MSLPVNWDLVPVRGRYVGTNGTPIVGRVIFTPKAGRLVDTAALTLMIGRAISATLDNNGSFEINLPATDDPDVTPNGFTYTVKEDFTGGSSYDISVPISALENDPAGIELAVIAPVSPNSGGALGPVSRLEYENFKANFEPTLLDDAIAAAQAAADEAAAAQAAAEAVGTTNDAIIAGRINTPGSATATALTATYVAAVNESGAAPGGRAQIVFNSEGFPLDIVLEDA